MKAYQQQFIEFCLQHQVLRFGEFTLKSGRISPYFFNSGLFDTGQTLAKLGEFYADAIMEANVDYDMVFGPAYKGIPLVTSTAIALAQKYQLDFPYAFNRKEVKDHGEGGNIVGKALRGKVLIIDDVITAGTATREAVSLITANGAKPVALIIALDREERGVGETSAIQEVEKQFGIPVISIITLTHLMTFLQQNKELRQHFAALENYRNTYGV